ncbi:MAG: Holliday junction resolvase RuvX [Cyanobacteria bacterium]|nr:Holliday junction resolvase RuvX [Cyanobacteriota bacterium]
MNDSDQPLSQPLSSETELGLPSRVLALDLGKKRVGLAVSDPLGHFAVGLDTVTFRSPEQLAPMIQALVEKYDVKTLIVGLPVHLKGVEGSQAGWVRGVAEYLAAETGCQLVYLDERLTSVIAKQSLREQGIQPSRPKVRAQGLVDQVAAMRLLQDYMDGQPGLKHL